MQTMQQRKKEKQTRQSREAEKQALLAEYDDTLCQLKQIRAAFQQVTDPELVSACVYQMNAMQRRYVYLLQRMKRENITRLRVLK